MKAMKNTSTLSPGPLRWVAPPLALPVLAAVLLLPALSIACGDEAPGRTASRSIDDGSGEPASAIAPPADDTADAGFHVRFTYRASFEPKLDICAAYAGGSNGALPVFDQPALLGSDGVDPTRLAPLLKVSRYVALPSRPVAFGLTKTGRCDDVEAIAPVVGSALYQTVVSTDHPSGDRKQALWALADGDVEERSNAPVSLRVMNAISTKHQPLSVAIVLANGSRVELGTPKVGEVSAYILLPASTPTTLVVEPQGERTHHADLKKQSVAFFARTTLILRSTSTPAGTTALLCADGRLATDVAPEADSTVFSRCKVLSAAPDFS